MGTEMTSASGPFNPTAKRFDINYFFFADSSCRFFSPSVRSSNWLALPGGQRCCSKKRTL